MKYTEFIAEVIALANAAEKTEVTEFAEKELKKYENAQVTRAAYAEKQKAKKAEAKAEVREKVLAVLTAELKTATEIVEAAGVEGLTRQAIPPLLKPLVEEGKVVKEQFTVAGAKGKVVGYKLA